MWKVPPLVWIPALLVTLILAGFIVTRPHRGIRRAHQWVELHESAWEDFRDSDPAMALVDLGVSTSHHGTLWLSGYTADPGVPQRVTEFINSLDPPRKKWVMTISVMPEAKYQIYHEHHNRPNRSP